MVDTSVLSLAFRRAGSGGPRELAARATLHHLIASNRRLFLPGMVMQEILAGIRDPGQFDRIRRDLGGFVLLSASEDDHVAAARLMGRCAAAGIAAKNVDCLIAVQTIAQSAELYAADADYERIAAVCPLTLHRP